MKPRTYLFPGTVNSWRADVPITEKIVWDAMSGAARRGSIRKHISHHTLRHSILAVSRQLLGFVVENRFKNTYCFPKGVVS